MTDIGFILLYVLIAFLVAWFVNLLVGLLRGEHPGDTGRVWWEVLLRMFAIGELGLLGRILNYGSGSWIRSILMAVGGVVLFIFIFQICRGE